MTDENTRQLIDLYQRTGSKESLDVIVIHHMNALHYVMNHYFKYIERDNPEWAMTYDDFIHYGLEEMYKVIEGFDTKKPAKFNTHLINTVRFRIIDELRRQKEHLVERVKGRHESAEYLHELHVEENNLLEPDVSFVNAIENEEMVRILNKHILKLDKTLMVILLNKYYGGTSAYIADQLGVSIARVSQLYTKAIAELRKGLIESTDPEQLLD